MIDDMEILRQLGQVEPLPAEALEGAEAVLRATMASARAGQPSLGDGQPSLGDGHSRLDRAVRFRARRRLVSVAAAAAAVAVVGAGGGYLATSSTPTGPRQAKPAVVPSKMLHAKVVAYVGSSPTLAVTSVPPGYVLANSRHTQGPTQWLAAGSTYWAKSFANPQGDSIGVTEMVNGTGTPKVAGFATAYPRAASHVTVGGHRAVLLDMNRIVPDPSTPNAHVVGYVLYWSVSPSAWVMIVGGSAPVLEQVGAGVLPAG
ncbi:MAG: hypothetical protein ACRDY2_10080 [Acidimicrobiales bacterium]